MKNTMYNKEKIFNKINQRNGLMVGQLYDWLPEDERPNRKYFTEFLRIIPGVKLVKYDSGENFLFATTNHKISMIQKRFSIMVEEFERSFDTEADFVIKEKDIPKLYDFFIKQIHPYYSYLEEAKNWMNFYLEFQEQTLSKWNAKLENAVIDLDVPNVELSMNNAPWKPPITLLQLFKRNIFISHVSDKNTILRLTFHLFDVNDNLNSVKLKRDIAVISAFLTLHKINVRYSVNVYTWSQYKKDVYEKQIIINKKKIERIKTVDWPAKDDLITIGLKGVIFMNLGADRLFNQKSGAAVNKYKQIKTVELKGKKRIKRMVRYDFRNGKNEILLDSMSINSKPKEILQKQPKNNEI